MLVDQPGPAEDVGRHVVHAVLRRAAAHQLQPLHVPALGAPQRQDAVLHQHVQAQRVDALLVDDDKALFRVAAAHLLLELDDLAQFGVDELSLALDQLLALVRARVEEARVDLGLLVLEAHIEREDVRVLDALGHVRVPRAMVQREAPDQLGVGGGPVLHLHDLDHEQVGLGGRLVDAQHGVHDSGRQMLGQRGIQLGGEGSSCDRKEQFPVDLFCQLELVEKL